MYPLLQVEQLLEPEQVLQLVTHIPGLPTVPTGHDLPSPQLIQELPFLYIPSLHLQSLSSSDPRADVEFVGKGRIPIQFLRK